MNPLLPWSIGLFCLYIACTFWQRRTLFSFSAIGLFWLSNFVFVVLGSLFLPLFPNVLHDRFYFIDWNIISPRDFIQAMAISVAGNLLVLAGYRLGGLTLHRLPGNKPQSLFLLTRPFQNDIHLKRLLVLSLFSLLALGGVLYPHFTSLVAGLLASYSGHASSSVVYGAREFFGSNYILVLLVFDILPFFAIALAASSAVAPWSLRVYGMLYQTVTVFFLLTSIQKVPLMIVLIGLGLAYSVTLGRSLVTRGKTLGGLVTGSSLLMVVLGALHMVSSSGRSFFSSMGDGVLGILGRISLSTPLLTAYYPGVDNFYGISNINIVSRFLERTIYPNTERAFQYFSHMNTGSCSFAATVDFFGMAGWPGTVCGNLLLGGGIYALDVYIARRPLGSSRNLLGTLAIMFTIYLAQASVFNSLMGYGGLFFFILWLMVRCPENGRRTYPISHLTQHPLPMETSPMPQNSPKHPSEDLERATASPWRTASCWLLRHGMVIGLLFMVQVGAYLLYGIQQDWQVHRTCSVSLPFELIPQLQNNRTSQALEARVAAVLTNDQTLAEVVTDQALYQALTDVLAASRLSSIFKPHHTVEDPTHYIDTFSLRLAGDATPATEVAAGLARVVNTEAVLLLSQEILRNRINTLKDVEQQALTDRWSINNKDAFSVNLDVVTRSLADCAKIEFGQLKKVCAEAMAKSAAEGLVNANLRKMMLENLSMFFNELPVLASDLTGLYASTSDRFDPDQLLSEVTAMRSKFKSTYAVSILDDAVVHLRYVRRIFSSNLTITVTVEPTIDFFQPRKLAMIGVAALVCAILGTAFLNWARAMRAG